jgi:hypothetical protein
VVFFAWPVPGGACGVVDGELAPHAAVAATLDKFVTTGEGTASSALDGAFRPWRTASRLASRHWPAASGWRLAGGVAFFAGVLVCLGALWAWVIRLLGGGCPPGPATRPGCH